MPRRNESNAIHKARTIITATITAPPIQRLSDTQVEADAIIDQNSNRSSQRVP